MKENFEKNSLENEEGRLQRIMRFALFLCLMLGIVIEGYYLVDLRSKIHEKTEEAKNISLQLQFLKQERDNLSEELSSVKTLVGEERDGDTAHWKH